MASQKRDVEYALKLCAFQVSRAKHANLNLLTEWPVPVSKKRINEMAPYRLHNSHIDCNNCCLLIA